MNKNVAAILLTVIPALALAQSRPAPELRRQVIAGAHQNDTQGPGSFLRTCVELRRLIGANELSFVCRWDDGTVSGMTVARSFDLTGQYPVGHDPQMRAATADVTRQSAMEAVLQGFLLLRTTRPEAPAKLLVQGSYSKAPNGGGIPVATNLTLILE